jgi:type I restriction enzyme S subunit
MDFAPWERDRYLLRSGDLLVCEGGEVGRTAMWRGQLEQCFYQKAIHRVRPRLDQEIPRFFYYLMYSLAKRGVFVAGGNPNTIDHLTAVQLRHYRFPFPPPSEQPGIAGSLDRETAKIDALVAKKERLIELLQEKRTALITRAVTKGLDPNVPTKHSGVEWLGEIPLHWEVKRIRNIANSLQTGPFGSQLHSGDYVSGGIPVINPSHLRDGSIAPDWDCAVDADTRLRLRNHELHEGDIIFARRGEMGRCALVTAVETGWLCGTGSLRIRPNLGVIHPPFLNTFLSISGVRDGLLLESVGATMDNLNTTILGRIVLLVPPIDEQRAIIAFLDRETAKIDALIAKVREGIEKLKEYRPALISAAVTGKIDVRDAGAPTTYLQMLE